MSFIYNIKRKALDNMFVILFLSNILHKFDLNLVGLFVLRTFTKFIFITAGLRGHYCPLIFIETVFAELMTHWMIVKLFDASVE